MDMWMVGFKAVFLDPLNLVALVGGSLIGIVSGVLPGIGATVAMSLLLPFTFTMPPAAGLILLLSIWASDCYGGSITSILVNVPGGAANVATCFDGHPMAKKGQAGVAIGIATMASLIGGLFAVIVLIVASPPIARIALMFGPGEYFMLAIMGLSIIATTTKGAARKGLIAAGFGLMVSFMGYDLITGSVRFGFGLRYLTDGIPFICALTGLFAIGEALVSAEEGGQVAELGTIEGGVFDGFKLVFKYPATVIRSVLIGTIFGAAPGVGVSAANMVAYSETVRVSKHPETFGKGDPEGVVAPEVANNAVQGGALIPTLTLGIPGSSAAAILLAALIMYGLRPGRELFTGNPNLVYTIFVALIFAQIIFALIGAFLANPFSKLTIVPSALVVPTIILSCFIGSFALRGDILDVLVTAIFGGIGYMMKRAGYPTVPFVLALILGPIAEKSFFRALLISQGSFAIFFSSAISLILAALIVFALFFPFLAPLKERFRKARSN